MKACSECGLVKTFDQFHRNRKGRFGLHAWCKECRKAKHELRKDEANETRRAYLMTDRGRSKRLEYVRKYELRNPEKIAAHKAVSYAIKRGELKKLPCEVCGKTGRIEAHHDDYSKPLAVRWLCRLHHSRLHKESASFA